MKSKYNQPQYHQVHLGKDQVCHSVVRILGNHWRWCTLLTERFGVQIEYGVYTFSLRAPQLIFPIEAHRGMLTQIRKQREKI